MGRLDDRRYAAAVLDAAVGGGMSSRLFQEIREKRGLVYSVGSALTHYAGAGAFSVYAGCSKKRVPEVLRLIREPSSTGWPPRASRAEEVARGRGQLKGGLVLGLEDTGSRMSRLGKSELSYGEYLPVREVLGRLDAVDEEQVRVGRRRAVQPGDLPGRGRARTASPTSTGSELPCARRCRSTAPCPGARSPSPSSCRWPCSSRRPDDVPFAPAGRGQARARRALPRAGPDRALGGDRPAPSWPPC